MLEISYPLFVAAVAVKCALAVFLGYYTAKCRALTREKDTTARAYAELLAGSQERERHLLNEVAFEREAFFAADLARKVALDRYATAEADADRLAPIVEQFLKDIDDTAALLKDENPPAMAKERMALSLHVQAQNLRTNENQPSPV